MPYYSGIILHPIAIIPKIISGIIDANQKHLGCKKGEANQKQQPSDYTCD